MEKLNWNKYCNIVRNDIVYKKMFAEYNLEKDPFPRFYKALKFLSENINQNSIHRNTKLIDFGCHNTQFLSLVKTYLGYEVTGVDNWSESENLLFDLKYLKMNIGEKWDKIENEKYDFITAFELIEHIIDTDNFIEQCKIHLNKGGMLLITTPNINSLRNRILVPFGRYPTGLEYKNIIHHVRLYNPSVLEDHLKEYGFKTIYKIGVNFFPHKITCRIKLIDNLMSKLFPSLCNNFILAAINE